MALHFIFQETGIKINLERVIASSIKFMALSVIIFVMIQLGVKIKETDDVGFGKKLGQNGKKEKQIKNNCTFRELNPGHFLGREVCYHYTKGACGEWRHRSPYLLLAKQALYQVS